MAAMSKMNFSIFSITSVLVFVDNMRGIVVLLPADRCMVKWKKTKSFHMVSAKVWWMSDIDLEKPLTASTAKKESLNGVVKQGSCMVREAKSDLSY